jgi:Domain of unknown function DUF29
VSEPSYDADFYSWLNSQAAILRQTQPEWLDWENVAEELEGMARSDRRALRSQLERLLVHLLKWRYEPAKRSGSWEATILDARNQIDDWLQESPSLKSQIDELFRMAYSSARREVGGEMGLDRRGWEAKFPAECEWTLAQACDADFWPD